MSHLSIKRRVPNLGIAFLILAIGVGVGWLRGRQVRDEILGDLVRVAGRAAATFEPGELAGIAGSPADVGTPTYERVKRLLQRVRAVDPEIRFVYVFREQAAAGRVIFLADSEAPGSKDISLPGDEYAEAAESPGLQAILAGETSATEGPLRDEFGIWVTAYARLDGGPAGRPREILGVDLSAAGWWTNLWVAGGTAAGAVWLFLGVPFAMYVVMRRQREQRAAIRNLSEAMEQAPSAVLILDPGFNVEYANAACCAQSGYARRDLVGRPWREMFAAATPTDVVADMLATARAGRTWSGDWVNQRKDGATYPVGGGIRPVRNRHQETVSYVAVFEDMTIAKRDEAELRAAKERAEAGDRAKGRFLATMSHEVRTPLNGIIGFTGLLLELDLPAEPREYVNAIRASSEILLQLTSDILDFARIESGKLKLNPQPCDPRTCIEGALDLMAAPAAAKRVELLHHIEAGVPRQVQVDSARLRQVLVNLINNAVKFTAAGEIEVTLRIRRTEHGGRRTDEKGPKAEDGAVMLEFAVRDTGIGIPADQHHRLFRAFSQVDDSSTRQFGGTGLGLAICKTIVQLMGGDISLASEPGRGSTFTFTIKVPVIEPAPVPTPRPLAGRKVALAVPTIAVARELRHLATTVGAEVIEIPAAELARAAFDVGVVELDDAVIMDLSGRAPDPAPSPRRMVGLVSIAVPAAKRTRLRRHFHSLFNKPPHQERLVQLLSEIAGSAPEAAPPRLAGHGQVEDPKPLAAAVPPEGAIASTPAEIPPAALAAPGSPAAEVPAAVPPQNRVRVLLVEDNAVNQRLMRAMLNNLGCRWTLAENGRLALEELAREKYDLVLMDLHMPEMDGVTAVAKIRAGEAGELNRSVWLIALTADAREDQRGKIASAGANGYLTKPIKRFELQAALEELAARMPAE